MSGGGVTRAASAEEERVPGESERRASVNPHRIARTAILWIVQAAALLLLAAILPGFEIDSFGKALATAAVLGLLNAILWPVLMRLALPAVAWTLGVAALVLNGVMLWLAGEILEGVSIDFGWAILAGLCSGAVMVAAASALSWNDDTYSVNLIRRAVRKEGVVAETERPGVIFLEIDGLAKAVLEIAIESGKAPTMAEWLARGSHRLEAWEPDLSSQTGASQAGILHGNNFDLPAFRWYEKETGTLMTSSRPKDVAEIERRISDGDGLLAAGGASRGNLLSGDAVEHSFTASRTALPSRAQSRAFYGYFANAWSFQRLFVLMLWDIVLERRAARRQRRRDEQPRIDHRGGIYPLLRAATTVYLRDLGIYGVMHDMLRGVPSVYATFVGYDEVAHHSGIVRPDALEVLRKLDREFARLERAAAFAPRPYHLVVLSDHGQTQGPTFLQRCGETLEDVVSRLIGGTADVATAASSDEGLTGVNAALTETIKSETATGKVIGAAVGGRMEDGGVALAGSEGLTAEDRPAAVVLASGNLGLVYLTPGKTRLTYEELSDRCPQLVEGLAAHEGIGFVLVRSREHGPLVVGADGRRYLRDGRVAGKDPLAAFGPNAPAHLLRTDGFPHAPDILVNSAYDPVGNEAHAFEELVGFHGGLGGWQTVPFVLFPHELAFPDEPVVGAESLHAAIKPWARAASASTDEPERVTSPG
jgi:uncharacterized membrane protein YvlD (DUF360 family)